MPVNSPHPDRRWLIIVRSDNASSTAVLTKKVTDIIEKISIGKAALAFNSKEASVVGLYAKIAKPARMIRSMLESTANTFDRGFVLVLEIGEEYSGIGNNTGWVWLQHH